MMTFAGHVIADDLEKFEELSVRSDHSPHIYIFGDVHTRPEDIMRGVEPTFQGIGEVIAFASNEIKVHGAQKAILLFEGYTFGAEPQSEQNKEKFSAIFGLKDSAQRARFDVYGWENEAFFRSEAYQTLAKMLGFGMTNVHQSAVPVVSLIRSYFLALYVKQLSIENPGVPIFVMAGYVHAIDGVLKTYFEENDISYRAFLTERIVDDVPGSDFRQALQVISRQYSSPLISKLMDGPEIEQYFYDSATDMATSLVEEEASEDARLFLDNRQSCEQFLTQARGYDF